jgi:hypothetical protein
MFDYTDLIPEVRRLIGDEAQYQLDENPSTPSTSRYYTLSQDAYCTVRPSGMLVGDVVREDFTVSKNVVKFSSAVSAGEQVSAEYDYVKYTDEQVSAHIGDVIKNVVQPWTEYDFALGVDIPAGYETPDTMSNKDVPNDMKALAVTAAALRMLNVQVMNGAGDAIYIKDGETTINTAVSSQEMSKSVNSVAVLWNDLIKRVLHNRSRGVAIYGGRLR